MLRGLLKSILTMLSLMLLVGINTSQAAPIVLKAAFSTPANGPTSLAFRDVFIPYVEKASNGKYKIDLYSGASFGSCQNVISSLKIGGIVHFSEDSFSNLSLFVPELTVFDIPFILPDRNVAERVMSEGVGKTILNGFQKHGITPLTFNISTFRVLSASKPLRNLEDAKGLKMRTSNSKIEMAGTLAMGMSPTPIPSSEMFTALQQKVADGMSLDISNLYARRIYEVCPNVLMTNHCPVIYLLTTNTRWFNALPKEDQAIFQEALRMFKAKATAYTLDSAKEQLDAVRNDKKVNPIVTEMDATERARWVAACQSVYDTLDPQMKKLAGAMREDVAAFTKP